jgi:choline dehydrogenase-like flavoprotein
VRGVDNLRVCDGSIFPDSSGANPQWTIMALAECCAEAMLAV